MMNEDLTVTDELGLVAKQGQEHHSAQILMIQLARLAKKNMTVHELFNEALASVGVESRTHAIRDVATDITLTMSDINNDTQDTSYNYQNLHKQQQRLDMLIDNYDGPSTQWLAYDLHSKNFYHKLSYARASKVLNIIKQG